MTGERTNPVVDQLRTALTEVREHRGLFSEGTFSTIVMALLEQIRRLQTNTTSAPDEIRQVTVMFIDVKDSMALSRAMDTGDFKRMLAEAHRRMSSLIVEWDGTIGQYLGDGILAFFGAQRSRGDDAIRCVACALAIQLEINRFANEVFLDYAVELSIRVGISTGRVVVGMVGAQDRQDLLALGPATNLAARLQSAAPPGGIYIDGGTQGRLRGQFRLQPRSLTGLRGFEDEALLVYEVLGRSAAASTSLIQNVVALPVPLVGREDILTEIAADTLTSLQERRLRTVLLLGDIGIGKSHILQETLDKVEAERFLRLQMVAAYEFQMKPYNLLRDFLTRFCALTDTMPAAEQSRRIVEVITSAWMNDEAEPIAELMGYLAGYGFQNSTRVRALLAEGGMERLHVHHQIARFFNGLLQTARIPLLLIVDNLHWADAESIRLLEVVASALQQQPVTILAAARPTLDALYPTFMQGQPFYRRLMLERLSDETTHRMIETILQPIERVPAHVVAMIVERAQGNPLFVIEFLSMLFDSGVFHRGRDGRWRFNLVLYDSTYKQLPVGLIEVIQSRLDDIDGDVRQVLQIASVVGQTFWKSIVDELTGQDQTSALDMLQIRGIIHRDGESTFEGDAQYSFRHSLYCDVAYEMVPRARREQLHRQIGAWMIGRVAGKPDFFTLLADQFRAAGDTEAALFTYLEAIQNSVQRGMLNEALKLVERALALGRTIPRDNAIGATVQIWILQAQALIGLRRYSEASASAQAALRLFSEMPPDALPASRVTALRLLGTAYTALGEFAQAQAVIDLATQRVDRHDPVQLSSVLVDLGTLELQSGRVHSALARLEQAIASARRAEMPLLLTQGLATQGRVLIELGSLGRALHAFEECLDLDLRLGLQSAEASDLMNIATIYLRLSLFDRAEQALNAAQQIRARQQEDDALASMTALLLACLRGGSCDDAIVDDLLSRMPFSAYRQWLVRSIAVEMALLLRHDRRAQALAQPLAAETASLNRLMHGRALMMEGCATARLEGEAGIELLQRGLTIEQELGGLMTARGALWLAEVSPAHRIAAYTTAAQSLYSLARDLANRTELRYAFLQTPPVRAVLYRAMLDDPDFSRP